MTERQTELLADWNAAAKQWDALAKRCRSQGQRGKTIDAYCRCANQAHAARGEIVFVLHSDAYEPYRPGFIERTLEKETAKLRRATAGLTRTLDKAVPLVRQRPRYDPPPSSLRLPRTAEDVVAEYRNVRVWP
jgi:hypothetical protein